MAAFHAGAVAQRERLPLMASTPSPVRHGRKIARVADGWVLCRSERKGESGHGHDTRQADVGRDAKLGRSVSSRRTHRATQSEPRVGRCGAGHVREEKEGRGGMS